MKIVFSEKSKKQLKKLPKSEAKKIIKKIGNLSNSPYLGKKLEGKFWNDYSIRAWPYRILYTISKTEAKVTIIVIQHRQGVYKN